ncbi:MAG: SRPBCC domain-containing protein [Ferruginibacter sp.]
MEKLSFEITILTAALKVYNTMLADHTYRQWTAVFNPGSFFEGKWEKDAKMLFCGINKEGKKEGMVSRIAEAIPGRQLSIEHMGILKDGEEITSGPQVDGWAGAMEEYFFIETDGSTLLRVEMDVNEDFKTYFTETWPRALEVLKQLCENN